jgi:hypothetical protein
METSETNWYIVKQTTEQCEILSEQVLTDLKTQNTNQNEQSLQQWGPFKTKNQAIAKRVGLIRAGKCQPS